MVRLALFFLLFALPAFAQDRDMLRFDVVLDDPDAQPFEGEMVLATLRGIYRETITNEKLKLRRMTDFDWMRLGQDVWTEQRIDGRPAKVMERRIALFPKLAGRLEILPIAHELELIDADGQREIVTVRSDPVSITVRPKPAHAGKAWLPVRALEISDSWSADAGQLEDGQSVERKVILRAYGAMPEVLPEQPPLREPWLITFAPPQERSLQVTPQGPVATVVWTWTMRPISGEPGVLHEVSIPYFDTVEGRARNITLPAAPIGYASFSDNTAAGWRRGVGVGWQHLALIGAGLVVALLMSARDRDLRTRTLRDLRGRLDRWRQRRLLRKYMRQGNIAAFRDLAARTLARKDPHRQDHILTTLRPLDDALFGDGPPPDAASFRRVWRGLSQ